MSPIPNENLILIEFLVENVTFNSSFEQDYLLIKNGDTFVSFQFLDNDPIMVGESEFTQKHRQSLDPCVDSHHGVKQGKSCLFSLTPLQSEEALKTFNVYVNIYKQSKCAPQPSKKIHVGETTISIVNLYKQLANALASARPTGSSIGCDSKEREHQTSYCVQHTPGPCTKSLTDTYTIRDPNNKNLHIGKIAVFIRMSCFGKQIVTQFQMNMDLKAVEFKSKEGAYRFKYSKKDGRCPTAKPPPPCSSPSDCGIYNPYSDHQSRKPSRFSCGTCASSPLCSSNSNYCEQNCCAFAQPPMPPPDVCCRGMLEQHEPPTCSFPPPCRRGKPLSPCREVCEDQYLLQQQQQQQQQQLQQQQQHQQQLLQQQLQHHQQLQQQQQQHQQQQQQQQQPKKPKVFECNPYCPAKSRNLTITEPYLGRQEYEEFETQMGDEGAMTVRIHEEDLNKATASIMKGVCPCTKQTPPPPQMPPSGLLGDSTPPCCMSQDLSPPPMPPCAKPLFSKPHQVIMTPGVPDDSNPLKFTVGGCCCECNTVCVNPPTFIAPDGTRYTEISDPKRKNFILRVGKKFEGDQSNRKYVDVHLTTPMQPDEPDPEFENKRVQYNVQDLPEDIRPKEEPRDRRSVTGKGKRRTSSTPGSKERKPSGGKKRKRSSGRSKSGSSKVKESDGDTKTRRRSSGRRRSSAPKEPKAKASKKEKEKPSRKTSNAAGGPKESSGNIKKPTSSYSNPHTNINTSTYNNPDTFTRNISYNTNSSNSGNTNSDNRNKKSKKDIDKSRCLGISTAYPGDICPCDELCSMMMIPCTPCSVNFNPCCITEPMCHQSNYCW